MRLKTEEIIKITQSALASLLRPGVAKKKLPKRESVRYPEIYLFRHGETYDNRNRVFSGWRDSRLTPMGVRQAQLLGKKLRDKKVDVCIISRLRRSAETAQLVFKGRAIVYETDNRIIERHYGKLTGKSKTKLMAEDVVSGVKYRRFYHTRPPGGESLEDVQKRVYPFCQELVQRVRRTGENIAISCHGNSMKIMRHYLERASPLTVLVQENPLGQDYAQYVVTPKRVLVGKTPVAG